MGRLSSSSSSPFPGSTHDAMRASAFATPNCPADVRPPATATTDTTPPVIAVAVLAVETIAGIGFSVGFGFKVREMVRVSVRYVSTSSLLVLGVPTLSVGVIHSFGGVAVSAFFSLLEMDTVLLRREVFDWDAASVRLLLIFNEFECSTSVITCVKVTGRHGLGMEGMPSQRSVGVEGYASRDGPDMRASGDKCAWAAPIGVTAVYRLTAPLNGVLPIFVRCASGLIVAPLRMDSIL